MTTDTNVLNAVQLVTSFKEQAETQVYAEVDDQRYFAAAKVDAVEIRQRILMERYIIRHFVKAVLARTDAVYRISVFDGEAWAIFRSRDLEAIMAEVGACDEERIAVRKGPAADSVSVGSLYLVYGNDGWDVIADNTDTDEFNALLASTDKLADKLCDAACDISDADD